MANKTSVIGFFNPNEYPLLLVVSEHNMQINLEPKKYIVDRTGALVNDPLLDSYVGKGKLSRARDPKQQVDIVYLRPVNPAPAPGVEPTPFSHAVSQATGFQVKDGRVQPVMPAQSVVPQANVPPPVSYNPVKAYTIEEAKRLKFVRPTKPVPEDFGADETTGAPKSGQEIPEIRYAVDSTRGRRPKPLPAELAQPASPQQAAIIAGLERAATVNPEDPNILRQARTITQVPAMAVLPSSGPIPGLPKPQLTESAAPAPRVRVAPPIPINPVPTQITLQAPEEEESGLVVEEDLEEIESPVPAPPTDESVECPRCPDKSFKNVGLLRRHVRKYHVAEEAELLKPFETATPV